MTLCERMKSPVNVMRLARCVLASIISLASSSPAGAQATADQLQFFESKIRPLLTENCYACHSSKAPVTHAGVRLDSRASILKGGDSEPSSTRTPPIRAYC